MSLESSKSKTALVTGGAGFIGSHVCEALLSAGWDAAAVDNFSDYYDPRYKRGNIAAVEETASAAGRRFELFEGDIRDLKYLDGVFGESAPDAVIHLAACAGVRPSIMDPVLYTEVNINGTVNVLECLKKHHVSKLLFASSSSVYGNNEKVPFSETDPVDRPISPYAATKKAGELICHTYRHLYGISTACLRFFTVYGPRQRPDLAIYKFTKLITEGRPVTVYGDGSSRRDYTFIGDIVDGVMKALYWVSAGEGRFDLFNLGEARMIPLNQMLETLENSLGQKAALERRPAQPGDVDTTCADLSHSRRVLGYAPRTDFEKGVGLFVDWYRKNRL